MDERDEYDEDEDEEERDEEEYHRRNPPPQSRSRFRFAEDSDGLLKAANVTLLPRSEFSHLHLSEPAARERVLVAEIPESEVHFLLCIIFEGHVCWLTEMNEMYSNSYRMFTILIILIHIHPLCVESNCHLMY